MRTSSARLQCCLAYHLLPFMLCLCHCCVLLCAVVFAGVAWLLLSVPRFNRVAAHAQAAHVAQQQQRAQAQAVQMDAQRRGFIQDMLLRDLAPQVARDAAALQAHQQPQGHHGPPLAFNPLNPLAHLHHTPALAAAATAGAALPAVTAAEVIPAPALHSPPAAVLNESQLGSTATSAVEVAEEQEQEQEEHAGEAGADGAQLRRRSAAALAPSLSDASASSESAHAHMH